jgi:hypothetical protein
MERQRKANHDGDVMLTLGATLIDALDDYREQMSEREPGIRASRSAAARQLLLKVLLKALKDII